MKIKSLIAGTLASTLLFSATCFAELQRPRLYFSPSIMNDVTGEILTSVVFDRTSSVVTETDGITSVEWEYTYDNDVFDISKNQDGTVKVTIDDDTLLKNETDVVAIVDGNVVHVKCTAPVVQDGTLFKFTLVAKSVSKLWNSFDEYPLKFVDGTMITTVANEETSKQQSTEGINTTVGAYNEPETFSEVSLGKRAVFELASSTLVVNGEVAETDATPIEKDNMYMVPMRYVAEALDMEVTWDAETSTAYANGNGKRFAVSLKDGTSYINGALCSSEPASFEKDGRTYIPVGIVEEIYPNALINVTGNDIIIYIK